LREAVEIGRSMITAREKIYKPGPRRLKSILLLVKIELVRADLEVPITRVIVIQEGARTEVGPEAGGDPRLTAAAGMIGVTRIVIVNTREGIKEEEDILDLNKFCNLVCITRFACYKFKLYYVLL